MVAGFEQSVSLTSWQSNADAQYSQHSLQPDCPENHFSLGGGNQVLDAADDTAEALSGAGALHGGQRQQMPRRRPRRCPARLPLLGSAWHAACTCLSIHKDKNLLREREVNSPLITIFVQNGVQRGVAAG